MFKLIQNFVAAVMRVVTDSVKTSIKESETNTMSALGDKLKSLASEVETNNTLLASIDTNVKALQTALAGLPIPADAQAALDQLTADITASTAATASVATDAAPATPAA